MPYGAGGFAVGCAVLLALTGPCYRVIGTGHWAYIAAAVVFAVGGLAVGGRALGGRLEVVAAVATTVAVLGCVAVPTLTARLARYPTPKPQKDSSGDDPFTTAEATSPGAAMPSAEQVWARVRSAELARSGLLAGLAVVGGGRCGGTVSDSNRAGRFRLCAGVYGRACAAQPSGSTSWPERAALAVPAVALTLTRVRAGPIRRAGRYGSRASGCWRRSPWLAVLAGLAVVSRGRWVSAAAGISGVRHGGGADPAGVMAARRLRPAGIVMAVVRRCAALVGAVLLVAAAGFLVPPAAGAIAPPVVEPGPPPTGPLGPPAADRAEGDLRVPTGTLPATDFAKRTSAEAMLNTARRGGSRAVPGRRWR